MPTNLNNIPGFLRDVKSPYEVPDGYFNQLEKDILGKTTQSGSTGNNYFNWQNYLIWGTAVSIIGLVTVWGILTFSGDKKVNLVRNEKTSTHTTVKNNPVINVDAITVDFSNSVESELTYTISGNSEDLKIAVVVNPSYNESDIFMAIRKLPFEKDILSKIEAKFMSRYQEYKLIAEVQPSKKPTSSSKNENYIVLNPGSTMKIQSDTQRSSEFTFKLPQKICSEGEVMLDATLPGGDFTYSWNTGAKSAVLKVNKSGIYQITATSKKKNGSKITGSVDVKILPKPSEVKTHMVIGCVGTPVELNLGINNPEYKVFWNGLNSFDNMVTVNDPGLYVAVIEGCKLYVDSFYVNFTHCDVFIPNAMSPNGDGMNETFVIQNIDKFPGTEISIFNRAGQMIYSNPNYDNSWNAENQPDGTYFYKIKFPDGIVQNGAISVLRK